MRLLRLPRFEHRPVRHAVRLGPLDNTKNKFKARKREANR